MSGRAAALVPAAGRGERLGPGVPKALRPVGGVPMLVHAVRALSAARSVDLVVVAAPADAVPSVRDLLASFNVPADVEVVAGGPTRQESVARALAVLPEDVDIVVVHDAARPLAPSELADAVVSAVRAGAEAVVPGLAVVDTVKEVDDAGAVVATLDRAKLRAVQTPQGFRRTTLTRAHTEAAAVDVTDDAGLVEAVGGQVRMIPGHVEAFKVTHPFDLVVAETIVEQRRADKRVP